MREYKKMTRVSLFSENENTCYVDIKPQDKIRSYDIRGQLWPALMAFHLWRFWRSQSFSYNLLSHQYRTAEILALLAADHLDRPGALYSLRECQNLLQRQT